MTADVNKTNSETNGEIQGAPIGERLKQAREDRGFSAQDVADLLYLTPNYIVAIEQSDIAQLPGRAFAQGYIRAYARLVDMDVDQALEAFDQEHGPEQASKSKKATLRIPGDVRQDDIEAGHPMVRWFSWFIGLVIILGAIYWMVERKADPLADAESASASAQDASDAKESGPGSESKLEVIAETESSTKVALPLVVESTPALDESVTAVELVNADATNAGNSQAEKNGESAEDDGTGTLNLAFSDDCWVSITDANGETLIASVKRAGEKVELEGQKPFSITLGKAAVVSMKFDGEDVDLTPYIQVNTARFVLGE